MASRLQDVILRGTAASRPAATTVAPGTLYYSTDTSVTERCADTGLTWEGYSDGGTSTAVANTGLCQGRLTTETGVAISTSDRTAQSTIYFTPYHGNRVALYSGSAWAEYALTERSLALSGLTSGKNYDVFLYNNAGTLTLELSAAWTNDTTRADALTTQDGVSVKSSATTRRLVGTIRTTATTTTEDSLAHRFVWNAQHRIARPLQIFDGTNTWTYNAAVWRQANGTATNHQVDYVVGLSEDPVEATVRAGLEGGSGIAGGVGIGISSTTVNSALLFNDVSAGVNNGVFPGIAQYRGYPGLGYRYIAWLEYVRAGTQIFEGDSGVVTQQSGIIAWVWN